MTEIKRHYVTIIGAGKAGSNVAAHLKKSKNTINAVISRRAVNARELAIRVSAKIYSSNYAEIPDKSDVIIIAVTDDAINTVVNKLSQSRDSFTGKTVVHLSGSITSSVLDEIAAKGGKIGSMHPMQTFYQREYEKSVWEGVYFGIEGDQKACDEMKSLIGSMNCNYIELTKKQKPVYHICGVFISNYVISLFASAEKLFDQAGIDKSALQKLFYPLLKQTAENIVNAPDLQSALTGPIKRLEISVIKNHIQWLQENNDSCAELYKKLGLNLLSIVPLPERKSKDSIKKIRELLMENVTRDG